MGEKLLAGLNWIRDSAPLAAVGIGSLVGAIWTEAGWWIILLLAFGLVISRTRYGWWAAVLLAAILMGLRGEYLDRAVRLDLEDPSGKIVTGELTIGRLAGTSERFGKLKSDGITKKVMVVKAADLQPGEKLEVTGRLFVPERNRNPGGFPKLERWRRLGVCGGLVINESKSVGAAWSGAPFRLAEDLRENLLEGITRGLPEESTGRVVIQAMVLGEKPPGDSEVSMAFRESGAMHVFAVSGLHVTLVGAIAWMVLSVTPLPRRAGLFLVILAMVCYAAVTGLRPPAVRATMMAVCVLAAFFLRRRPSLVNALSLSLILVLLWRPSQALEVGFQLSYGVLMSIALGVGLARKFTGKFAELDSFFPSRLLTDGQRRVMNLRRYFSDLGASSLAAWIGSVPLIVWHFGIVTPVAVLTSLLLIPGTMVILALGFLATFAGLVIPVTGEWVNQVNSRIASSAYSVARGFSKVPLGHWYARRMTPADWVVFDTQDGGAASYLDVPGGTLIDVGGSKFYQYELSGILRRWIVSPEQIAISHGDARHSGGLPLILEKGSLRSAILPTRETTSPSYRDFLRDAEGKDCKIELGEDGKIVRLDENVWIEVLREDPGKGRGIADNRIMVMKVHWHGWRILVTSDLGLEDELGLLRRGIDLSSEVVLMGRHAWGVSGQLDFLKATGATVVVTSAANFPPYEMPSDQWCSQVEEAGFQLFNQRETGAVLFDFREEAMTVRSYLQEEKSVKLYR